MCIRILCIFCIAACVEKKAMRRREQQQAQRDLYMAEGLGGYRYPGAPAPAYPHVVMTSQYGMQYGQPVMTSPYYGNPDQMMVMTSPEFRNSHQMVVMTAGEYPQSLAPPQQQYPPIISQPPEYEKVCPSAGGEVMS